MSDVAVLILCAGRSTRVRDVIGERQKTACVVGVPGYGAVSAVVYQVEYARAVLPKADIYVVVGWKAPDVIAALISESFRREGFRDVYLFFDREVRGIANVWRQFLWSLGSKYGWLVSINGDDIHLMSSVSVVREGIENVFRCGYCGAVVGTEVSGVKGKSVYVVDEFGFVRGVREKVADACGKVGTGIYVLRTDELEYVSFRVNRATGEVEPGDVLNELIGGGCLIKWVEHRPEEWIDIGNPNILRKYVVSC